MQQNSVWAWLNYRMALTSLSEDTPVNLEQSKEICLDGSQTMFSHYFNEIQSNEKIAPNFISCHDLPSNKIFASFLESFTFAIDFYYQKQDIKV